MGSQTDSSLDITPVLDKPCANKRLYSVDEAAVYLGRTVWSVRKMLYAGKIPYVKDGRRQLLDIRDMDTWIDRSKTRNVY